MSVRNRINKREHKAHKVAIGSARFNFSLGSTKSMGSVCDRTFMIGSSMNVDEYRLMIDDSASSIFHERSVLTNTPIETLR
jgi:hypothetical protein